MAFQSKVALVKGNDRYANITQALALISSDIDLSGKKSVLVKPNFISTTRQLAATHVDGVRAVLDWLRDRYDGPITIGEGPAIGDAFAGYRNFGYLDLAEEYGVQFIDLNRDEWVPVQVYDRKLRPMWVRAARTAVESDFRIAVGPPKTHDTVIVTASLKNMVMGSLIRGGPSIEKFVQLLPNWVTNSSLSRRLETPFLRFILRNDKSALHQGYQAINLSLYTLAKTLSPHLSVNDGFMGMEGEGPVDGDPMELEIAIASTDFLAADAVAVKLMGFDLDKIGYLYYCKLGGLGVGDLEEVEIVGNITIEECIRDFKPHSTYKRQLEWKIPDIGKFL